MHNILIIGYLRSYPVFSRLPNLSSSCVFCLCDRHVSDATPVMFLAFFLFTIPVVTENGEYKI